MFFLSSFSCNFNDQLSKKFHRLVILCICWDTQVRILIFDNYQSCSAPLSIMMLIYIDYALKYQVIMSNRSQFSVSLTTTSTCGPWWRTTWPKTLFFCKSVIHPVFTGCSERFGQINITQRLEVIASQQCFIVQKCFLCQKLFFSEHTFKPGTYFLRMRMRYECRTCIAFAFAFAGSMNRALVFEECVMVKSNY